MSPSKTFILLWLEGALQSWGHNSKFGVRDTLSFPTRSGILGLLCCARGAGGAEIEWLAEMNDMSLEIRAYLRRNNKGQPCLPNPNLCDLQMVGSGYDDTDPWQSLLIPKTSGGKKAVGGGTKMTYRYYLQDSVFAAVLEIPESQVDILSISLQNPEWDLYLGRKCCVPTEFIYQGVYTDANAAWKEANNIAERKKLTLCYAVIEGEGEGEGEHFILNDVPVQFGIKKCYRDRRVTILNFV
ncbi:type I-E CRISPR-associated protein Cas5/CasD [Pantoea sp. A4]|uniref:type I-E CRISPR-associated protein Cas5/CasD n=1 Tax=Pantoea sp. A4 TaxID=1225184 RepID=UPI00037399B7|nr:type I-E CRISPR-associated protein Cas5/CasD [Pantoea sp. A4]